MLSASLNKTFPSFLCVCGRRNPLWGPIYILLCGDVEKNPTPKGGNSLFSLSLPPHPVCVLLLWFPHSNVWICSRDSGSGSDRSRATSGTGRSRSSCVPLLMEVVEDDANDQRTHWPYFQNSPVHTEYQPVWTLRRESQQQTGRDRPLGDYRIPLLEYLVSPWIDIISLVTLYLV